MAETVVAGSQGGRFLPVDLAKAGHRVALIERDQLGGACVNTGCTPTKTMVASARLAHQARRGAEFGVRTGPVSVDLAAVRERKRAMVAGARENYASRLAQDGLDLIEGEARFVGPHTIVVGNRRLSAPVIVDSRFGSKVTIVQSAARLLMLEDDDVTDEIAGILRDEGIEVLTSSTPLRVERAGDGIRLTVRTEDGDREIEGSHLLSAIGRTPNTEALDVDAAGIRLDGNGYIHVDEHLETSVPGVYAMGDVRGGPAFTHASFDDYRVLHANLVGHEKVSTRDRLIPYAVFIDPQLGRVGLNEREARAQGLAVRVSKVPMGAVVRAIETGETRGFMKALVDANTGQILGASVLGSEGGEIMSIIQTAMLGNLTYRTMADAIFTHPLLAEGLNTLFAAFDA
jgi:pyruvate/2-oxoglutarate dehydrogenase complex dihydrolipoamide dehydrogenase (E3) component